MVIIFFFFFRKFNWYLEGKDKSISSTCKKLKGSANKINRRTEIFTILIINL